MGSLDGVRILQVSYGACQFQYAVIGASGQLQLVHRLFEQLHVAGFHAAMFFDLGGAEFGVALAGALKLSRISGGDAGANGRAALASGAVGIEGFFVQLRYFDVDVDAIEQRRRDAVTVFYLLFGRAPAQVPAVATVALRA